MQMKTILGALRAIATSVCGVVVGLAFCLYTLLLGFAAVLMIFVVAVRSLLEMAVPQTGHARRLVAIRVDGLTLEARIPIPALAAAQ